MLLRRIVGSVNWKYAIGEIVLIVLGVTIALAINSWYGGLQDRGEEVEYLERLRLSLQADRDRLRGAERRIEADALGFAALRDHLLARLPHKAELDPVFSALREWEIVALNTAVYESLRSRGLDLISDRDLQMQLINVYENGNRRLEKQIEYDEQLGFEQVGPYLYQKFELGSETASPYDYEALLDDKYYLNLINVRRFGYEIYTLPIYRRSIEAVEDLLSALDAELAERE